MESLQNSKNISFFKLREFIRSPSLSSLEKCIFIDLLLYAGTTSEAFPSQKTLAADFDCTDRQVRNALKSLKQRGWILEWKKRGYSKSNRYKLNEELYFHIEQSNRKSISLQLGNKLPIQSGTPIPPKVNNESTQISGNGIQQLFEKINRRPIRTLEIGQLSRLCQAYSSPWVSDAIRLAQNRGKTDINPSYLSKILEDWQLHGKPPPKPVFEPCRQNGCREGLIFKPANNTFLICDCRAKFDTELKDWNKKWGNKFNI